MAYTVLARKYRPKRFDDVVGQQAVTRTLKNALASGRLAHAFVFAGPRGVGKTTTARILACAFNCEKGPTSEPCGTCDACLEIADGRSMDVLEIDAATHTQVENVREVIIEGIDILPVRDRKKIFIIDEVHQLSSHSFNALLKSVEEPPPHVVFMMATTELDRIPETILSRSQVYEFRTIATRAIAAQLRKVADQEGITVGDDSLQLVARDADGSMRDAESKLDQVIAFTGTTIGPDDVATVLGLVGRDLLLDAVQAVAEGNAVAAFDLAGRAVEMGYDLRLVCRELSRVVRDLLVLSVDPERVNDAEIAGEGERDRLLDLARRFSREDLLRAFDLLTKAEFEIRNAAQPRYHLEMALLRWIHLRKLVAIEDLIQLAGSGAPLGPQASGPARSPSPGAAPRASTPAAGPAGRVMTSASRSTTPVRQAPVPAASAALAGSSSSSGASIAPHGPGLKDAFLSDLRSSPVLYGALVAQAQLIEVAADRIVLTFAPEKKIDSTFEKYRPQLEATASRLAGRKMTVVSQVGSGHEGGAPAHAPGARREHDEQAPAASDRKLLLKEQALADASVQAMLEVFPVEIRDVEEL